MKIKFGSLAKIVDRKVTPGELSIVGRHYCIQLYMNGLCTTKCIDQCSANITRAFDVASGEFILNPNGYLVQELRQIVHNEISKVRDTRAKTPKNDLGERVVGNDVFAELTKHYGGNHDYTG